MKKLVVAVLFAVLCSTSLFTPIASAHTVVRQVKLTCDPTVDPFCPPQQQQCVNYPPGQSHNDLTDPPQCPTQQQPGRCQIFTPGCTDQEPGNSTSCPVNPNTGLDCHGQPHFVCIGGGFCNGQQNGNTGLPLPSDNGGTEATIECLQDVVLTVGEHVSGIGEIIDGYKIVHAVYTEGRDLITLAKTSDTPGPASIKLVLDVGSSIIPLSGCGSLIGLVLGKLKHKL